MALGIFICGQIRFFRHSRKKQLTRPEPTELHDQENHHDHAQSCCGKFITDGTLCHYRDQPQQTRFSLS